MGAAVSRVGGVSRSPSLQREKGRTSERARRRHSRAMGPIQPNAAAVESVLLQTRGMVNIG